MTSRSRRTTSGVLAISAVAGVLAAGPLLTSALDAQPNSTPNPPLKVLEQNLDANGFIKVHEQGVANVTGKVSVTGGSLSVTNFPSAVNVHLAPVSGAYTFHFGLAANSNHLESFATINTTAIHTFAPSDEFQIVFQSPLSSLTDPGTSTPNTLLRLLGSDGELESFIKTFTQPVPLNGLRIFCQNESSNCAINLTLIGTSQ